MKRVAFVIFLLALLCAGCVDQKENNSEEKADAQTVPAEASPNEEPLSIAITSPRPGDILTGDKEFDFVSS
jgi:serine protease inhibitor